MLSKEIPLTILFIYLLAFLVLMSEKISKGRVISAAFLVAGTCIGGGMLALPVMTGVSGFFPSTILMAVCWIAMTLSALLLIEASLWMPEGAHVITISERLLGTPGKWVSWILYLFISYASLVAYTALGGTLIVKIVAWLFNGHISSDIGALIFILLFGAIVDFGTEVVGRINSILVVGMIGAYFGIVLLGIDEIKPHLLLEEFSWSGAVLAIPLLLTTFSFQTMVPSLTPYLKRDGNKLKIAIAGGTSIVFLVYLIWQILVLGIIPAKGPKGLNEAYISGEAVNVFLWEHVQGQWVTTFAEFFAFFALITSFLGIALGLFDFLADGLKIEKKGKGKITLGLLIVVPVLLFATQFERIFLLALETTGGIGDSILNGMIPVLMVWMGRYVLKLKSDFEVFGGKPLLVSIFAFFLFSLTLELLVRFGLVCSIFDLCVANN